MASPPEGQSARPILPEFSARVSRSRRYFLILRPYIAICFMKEENSKVTRQRPLRRGTTACRPKFEHEFRLRPARLGDYFFALSLYLEGAQKHLSKIGQWNRPGSSPSSGRDTSGRRRRSFASGTRRSAGFRSPTSSTTCICGSSISSAEVRGQGIGTRLIKELLQRADALGKYVTLDVMHGNPARLLYLRLGFRQISQNAAKRQMIWRPPRG